MDSFYGGEKGCFLTFRKNLLSSSGKFYSIEEIEHACNLKALSEDDYVIIERENPQDNSSLIGNVYRIMSVLEILTPILVGNIRGKDGQDGKTTEV